MALSAAKFHARFFQLIDEDEEIVITKHGRPVARVLPYRAPRARRRNGAMAGTAEVLGDIDAPCLPALDGDREHVPA